MKKLTGLLIFCLSSFSITFSQQNPLPFTDLHKHLRGASLDAAAGITKRENIQYGILASVGTGFIHIDHQIDSFLLSMKKYPMFYVGIQAEGREWVSMFSKEALRKLDYIVSDAMTFTDEKGRRNLIYIKDKTWIDDENRFMDYYVKITTDILNNEPINIYVNPTYLPVQISGKYEELWTRERMEKVISAAVKNGIAIEISNRYNIPSGKFIEMAKKAGAKFTVGTNNNNPNFPGAEYAGKMIRECGLTEKDFYLPETRNGVTR